MFKCLENLKRVLDPMSIMFDIWLGASRLAERKKTA
jgi:hypothetical protein